MKYRMIHHLNCGTLNPPFTPTLSSHCLLIETQKNGLVLVDTGLGVNDIKHPKKRLGVNRFMLGAKLDINETANAQIKTLGYSINDVQHMILTHMDYDHTGGISDFPNATVHVSKTEWDAAQNNKTPFHKRYRDIHWKNHKQWNYHSANESKWKDLDASVPLFTNDIDIRLVSLPGHTLGHCGVAIESNDIGIFHAGDSHFQKGEISPIFEKRTPLGLTILQKLISKKPQWESTRQKLKLLRKTNQDIKIICSHDMALFSKFKNEN